jgi:hypothetical protein
VTPSPRNGLNHPAPFVKADVHALRATSSALMRVKKFQGLILFELSCAIANRGAKPENIRNERN